MEQFAPADLAKILDDLRRWVAGACGVETGLLRREVEPSPEAGNGTGGGPGP